MDQPTLDEILALVQEHIDAYKCALQQPTVITNEPFRVHYETKLNLAETFKAQISYLKEQG